MMEKRKGFTRRAMMNHHLKRENFDPIFQFRPFKLYIITDFEGKYAITSEKDSDDVFLSSPPSKDNKYQWVLLDTDTGAICFFYDLKSYMSINLVDGVVNVKRSDVLKDGLFNFNSDNTIQLKANTNYCLAYKKITEESKTTDSAATGAETTTTEKKESFFRRLFSDPRHSMEFFDPKTQPALEAVRYENIDDTYSNKWKYVEVHDLRTLTDNAETINELQTINSSGSEQISALQKLIENNKKMCEIETTYRDEKINGYEKNWFINLFLK